MTTFSVLQPHLTEERIAVLNGPEGGWGCAPWATAYSALTLGPRRNQDPSPLVEEAFDNALLQPGWIIHTSDHNLRGAPIEAHLESLFAVGNGMRGEAVGSRLEGARSVSVGDVAVWYEGDVPHAAICASLGWKPLPEALAARLATTFKQVFPEPPKAA